MRISPLLRRSLVLSLSLSFTFACETEVEAPVDDGRQLPEAKTATDTGAEAMRKSKIATLPMEEPILTIDGTVVTRADLERTVIHRAAQLGAAPDKIPPLVRDELEYLAYDALIRRVLLDKEAARRGFKVDAARLAAEREALKKAIPEGHSLDEVLKKMHTDVAGLERDLSMDMRIDALQKDVTSKFKGITEEEARKVFTAQPERFTTGEQASVSEILIALAPDAKPEAVEAALKRATALRGELEGKSKEEFQAIAREKSDDPKAKQTGGDQGWFGLRERVPEFGAVAFSLKKGMVSDPFRTGKGFHILFGQGVKKGKVADFDKVKARIIAIESVAKRRELDEEMVKGLMEKATIVRHHEPLPPPGKVKPQPASMPGMGGQGMPGMGTPGMPGKHGNLPLPTKDNVLPGAPNPHAGKK